jgi:hypothetical protein
VLLTSIAISRLFEPEVLRLLIHKVYHGIEQFRELQQDDDARYQAGYNADIPREP